MGNQVRIIIKGTASHEDKISKGDNVAILEYYFGGLYTVSH